MIGLRLGLELRVIFNKGMASMRFSINPCLSRGNKMS